MRAHTYDVLVIGGGPAGATAGALLAQTGWSVVVAEKQTFPRMKVCGEYLSAPSLRVLDRVGIGEVFRLQAGPPVRQLGIFAGTSVLRAPLPRPIEWGRALSRERLDTLLLDRARQVGASVRQPAAVVSLTADNGSYLCRLDGGVSGSAEEITTRIIVAAHGSWNAGTLPTQPERLTPAPSDLFGFKAHFQASSLPADFMPLLAFPGGYGGMVHVDQNRISLSCCVRRDRLAALRNRFPGDAGDAVEAHLKESCRGVRLALLSARRQSAWLGAGPIRPGIRLKECGGIFLIGNAAGEAHPVIAEGISMAIESAWVLCRRLASWRRAGADKKALRATAHAYAEDWRRHFVPRLRLSQVVAEWAMRPAAVASVLPFLRSFPGVLTWLARLSGKAG